MKRSFFQYVSLNVLGALGLSGYILADTLFVAHRLGTDGLAALNLAISVFGLINGLGLMLGIGGATRYAICRTQGDGVRADRAFSRALACGGALGGLLALAGLLWAVPLARLLGAEGAILGARASYIAGCSATACTMADQRYGSPATGTMAHSWVQMFPDEYTAFKTYCQLYPHSATLLVDTYNVLKSGVPNAIKAFKDILLPQGITNCAIRLDSGDLTYLSRKARKMLDAAGLTECKIVASNSLDEYIIRDLLLQGAKIDSFGVGERLITSKSEPVFGGVYKLAAAKDKDDAEFTPKIKLSENSEKVTNPGNKTIYRIYDKETGKIRADLICLADETFDESKDMIIFDPIETWKKTKIKGGTYTLRELLVPIFQKGACVYTSPSVMEIRDICTREKDTLWEESKRLVNPHEVYVDLSDKLYHIKSDLLEEMSMKALGEQ